MNLKITDRLRIVLRSVYAVSIPTLTFIHSPILADQEVVANISPAHVFLVIILTMEIITILDLWRSSHSDQQYVVRHVITLLRNGMRLTDPVQGPNKLKSLKLWVSYTVETFVKSNINISYSFFFSAWMYQYPYWAGRCPNGQCMLGVVLSGARNPARWSDALRQNYRGWWWFLQHLL